MAIHSQIAIPADPIGGEFGDLRGFTSRRCDAHPRLRGASSAIRRALAGVDGPIVLSGPDCRDADLGRAGEVLVCLDGSARSAAVLAGAASMAEQLGGDAGGRLCLVAVLTPADAGKAAVSGCDAELVLGHQLASAAHDLTADGFSVEWDVLHGASVPEAVIAHAEARGDRIIAVNSHAGATRSSALVDPMWMSLVRRATVPVLLTRVTERPPPRRRAGPPPQRPRRRAPASAGAGRRLPAGALRAPTADDDSRPRVSLRAHWPAAMVFALVVAVLVTGPTPYISQHGGLRPVIASVNDAAGGSPEGRLLYPVIVTERNNILEGFRGWLDPDVAVRPHATLSAAALARSVDQVETAKRSATVAALQAIAAREPPTSTRVLRSSAIRIDSGATLGPSAGLAYAVGIVDLLSPGDLLGGRTVVITGEIHQDGTVAPVRGVRMKAAASRAAGADLFIVPCPNLAEAIAAAGLMPVSCVNSLDDAIGVLMRTG